VIGSAVKVMRILTGEEAVDYGNAPTKDQAAAELGRKGGSESIRAEEDRHTKGGCKERRRVVERNAPAPCLKRGQNTRSRRIFWATPCCIFVDF
jgi:hypothetical protein